MMSENVIKICFIILILGQIFECKNKIMERLKCEGIHHENTVIRNLKNSEHIKNIVFHKTHKCSSTTIQNILFRYAINNELLVVLPKVGHNFLKFKYQKIQNTEWYQAGIQPHIFCLHSIWDGSEVAKLFKNEKPYYFSIIRDPLSLLISSWDYFGFDRMLEMDLEGFASLVAKSKGM